MKIHRPLWAEGTFLSSQQFQQQARWEAFSNDSIAQLCIRHPWGIANVLFDRDALMSGKLKTQAVRLRFADGTLIDSDVSDVLPLACDLHALTNDSAVVLLALPLAHGNGGNLGQGEQTERPLRYRQEWQKVQDIYGSDSEDMAVERHALSLRFAHDNNQDYITCPLARLVRDVQGNWTQDEGYIPPLLAFNAHDGLVQRLDTLLLQLRAKCQRLMAMRRESNQRMADFAVADVSLFWLLNALNSAEPVLSDFLRYPAVHPELVWRELARLAGALLTFSLEHNVSAVPPYVHESPSTVFPPLFSLLSELLEASLPSRVIALDLGSLPGNRWKADLHDPRLREEADFYLSVRSSLPAHQVLHQLPLVCKIGAPDDVTLLINVALNGVPLVPLTSVPAALPLRLENQYFALDMHSDAAKTMLESGCCMIYTPGTMGDLKPELFAVLRT
ncbi:TPA: type VI secretion system baseplate subunit TssK [Escherichia coli]|nr:type VI secretion system baseplate subunit TssK [Escherichia coli]